MDNICENVRTFAMMKENIKFRRSKIEITTYELKEIELLAVARG